MASSIRGFGAMQGMDQMGFPPPAAATLTDDQKQQVKDILSKYDAKNLSASDAQAIFKAFQDAGIKGGSDLIDTIKDAGFDPEDLRAKGMPHHHRHHHGGTSSSKTGGGTSSNQGINTSTLQELQSILSQYDLTNMTDDQKNSLMDQLTSSGLMKTGNVINLSA